MAARQSLESLVLWLYTYDKKLSQPFDNSLSNLLREPCFTKLVPEHVILKMDTIRIIGNKYGMARYPFHLKNKNGKLSARLLIYFDLSLVRAYLW